MTTTTLRTPATAFAENRRSADQVRQPQWQRILLLGVLAYEGAGALVGGSLLVAAPDGRLMKMPVDMMHGVFPDFLIPGIILFGLGILSTIAFVAVFRRTSSDWMMAGLALGGLAVWFWVEIAILLDLHWLHLMWGLPVIAGGLAVIPLIPSEHLRKALLSCGILSSVLYVAVTIIVPTQWVAYDNASQAISELSAVGAPTRTLWMVLATPYTFLILAFAWGVLKSAGENRRLRIAGWLLFAYGALGFLWPFAPMHLRETLAAGGGTFSDDMHLALAAVTQTIYFLALILTAAALSRVFRIYSIATFVVLVFFGALTFMEAQGIDSNEPTPMMGVWERINIGVFLIWIVVLAVVLWSRKSVISH